MLLFTTGIDAPEQESKWRMGFNYSLEENKSFNYLPANSSGFTIGYGARYDKPNYRFGVNISYQLREKLTLNSALNYSNKDFTAFVGCLNCTTLAPFSDDFLLRFIEIPLTPRQELFSTKLRPFIELGINNFFLFIKDGIPMYLIVYKDKMVTV